MKHYRDVHYKLYNVTNDGEGYKRSMRGYQLIIKAWMQNHGQEIVEAVTEICKQEDDARIKIKFISAGYDLASGQDALAANGLQLTEVAALRTSELKTNAF